MHALVRHMAVRLWATFILGGLLGLWLMPWFQGQLGLNWLLPAVACLFLLCFLAIGYLFRQWGNGRISSLVQEAAGFERDGMAGEALTCYRRAIAHLDSFLMSPRMRRRLALPLARRLARFYIACADEDALRGFIPAYLTEHPEDTDVAEFWVKQTEQRGGFQESDQELATLVSSSHPENLEIQRILAWYFLFLERTDYPALAAYRCVWNAQPAPALEFKRSVARLLKRDRRVDEWSLEAYLALLGDDPPSGDLREALAACIHLIADSPAVHGHLVEARQALSGLKAGEIEALCHEFRPSPAAPHRGKAGPPRERWLKGIRKRLSALSAAMVATVGREADRVKAGVALLRRSARARKAAVAAFLAIVATAVGLFAWNTLYHLTKPPVPPSAQKVQPPAVAETDPFTLQVAAYLNLDYARKYVSELRENGLDAYWSTAVSGKKKWYQVRISHFATKAEALRLGESLKAKGLIDDFYVANYIGAQTD